MLVAVEKHLEQVGAVVLVVLCGVVVLRPQDGVEGLVGGVVGAGFADGFELAVEEGGPV